MVLKMVIILLSLVAMKGNIEKVELEYGIDGNIDPKYCIMLEENLSVVPDFILSDFYSSGWRVYITDRDIDDTFCEGRYGSVMGLTIYENKVIFLEDRDKVYDYTIVHELGHWFDCEHDYCSNKDEFVSIFEEETYSFEDYYGIDFYYNRNEMYAEGFLKYFVDPEGLQVCSPKMYDFIDTQVKEEWVSYVEERMCW